MKRALYTGVGILALMAASQSAGAADLPRGPVMKAVPVAAMFSWTGGYVGAHAGWAWGETEITDVDQYSFSTFCPPQCSYEYSFDGFVGGVQAGYNWQSGNLVFGTELDFSYSDAKRTLVNPLCCAATETFTTDINWLGTARVRLGYAVDLSLWYLTGGVAFADIENRYDDPTDFNSAVSSKVEWGWTAGAGLEYAFAPNWSFRAEYLYVDLGDTRASFPGEIQRFDFSNQFHVARAALNYRFATGKAPAPVVTKY